MTTTRDAARARREPAWRGSPPRRACDLYLPGHLVHFIQAKKASTSDDPVRWGRSAGIESGRLVVRFLDCTERYRIHPPEEVAAVAEAGDKVRVSERWRLATVTRRFEPIVTVCIALPDDSWRPCSAAPAEPDSLEEELVELLGERGGFVVPGWRAALLLDAAPDERPTSARPERS